MYKGELEGGGGGLVGRSVSQSVRQPVSQTNSQLFNDSIGKSDSLTEWHALTKS